MVGINEVLLYFGMPLVEKLSTVYYYNSIIFKFKNEVANKSKLKNVYVSFKNILLTARGVE